MLIIQRTIALGLACAALFSTPLSAQVGILGGVPGDAEDPGLLFPQAERAVLKKNNVKVYSLPLNGARNFNFYYGPGGTNGFIGSGPYSILYADGNDNPLNCVDPRYDDAVYQPAPPIAPSNSPYNVNSGYTNSADVFNAPSTICRVGEGMKAGPGGSPAQNPANTVFKEDGTIYAGALGIQGFVEQRIFTSGPPVLLATVDLIRRDTGTGAEVLVASIKTNAHGLYSFYYIPAVRNKYGFIPPSSKNTRYRVQATYGGGTAGTGLFSYAPDPLKSNDPTVPLNNEDYYVVGARSFDTGAGQPTLRLPVPAEDDRVAQKYDELLERARKELAARIDRGEYAPVELGTLDASVAASLGRANDDYSGAPGLEVFPNPASGALYVQLTGEASDAEGEVAVYDVMGRRVLSERVARAQERNELDVSRLAPGLYVVEVRSGSTRIQKRITVTN